MDMSTFESITGIVAFIAIIFMLAKLGLLQ